MVGSKNSLGDTQCKGGINISHVMTDFKIISGFPLTKDQ